MGRFIKGDVVVIPFPFSDLSNSKRRPALVLASLKGDDLILCQITGQNVSDDYFVHIEDADFITGTLNKPSNIRPNRLFKDDKNIILYKIGSLNKHKINDAINTIITLLNKKNKNFLIYYDFLLLNRRNMERGEYVCGILSRT